VNVVFAAVFFAALLAPLPGQAASPAWDAGKSFLDHARTTYAEEPPYSVPANFPGPLAPQPRREPETSAMLLACLGLMLYRGFRRSKSLAAASP
jgi:hypothetical protein